ncbi:30S ribosomal protein S5 [Patescibacteria group bacterium]|nr:30S ribosomal protein S5 [Patescibacteria group bacterium]MBU1953059.1 30S ribosomal protein S5 [Patescibacteria group bacterium]
MDRRNQRQRFNSPRVSEYEEKVIEIKRVSKKIKGGNAVGFTALVVLGNRNGKVGHGYGKAKNVAEAIQKALTGAKKKMINIKLTGKTIAHDVDAKLGSAKVALRPASEGSGIIAGGSVRVVVELAGIKDISAKMLGSNNKLSNVRCTIKALEKLKK